MLFTARKSKNMLRRRVNRADTKVPAGFGVAAVRAVSSGADDVCICIVEMLLLDLLGKGVKPSRYI